jgi:hypothetical protein
MNLADFTRRYALIVPTKSLLQYGLIRANGTSHREAVLLKKHQLLKAQTDMFAVARHLAWFQKWDIQIDTAWVEGGRSDPGDLQIREPGGEWQVIEVKGHPNKPFKDLNKYPWTLIDKVQVLDRKEVMPHRYFILGKERDQALVVDMALAECTVQLIKDQFTDELEECYGVFRSHPCIKHVHLKGAT